jgi:hypothetical protein
VKPLKAGEKVDLYNAVTQRFVAHNISTTALFKLPAQNAAVIVCVPAGGRISYEGNKMLVDGIVVDYMYHKKNGAK